MKVLQTDGLKAFMASIRDKFISKSDTVEAETLGIDNNPIQNSDNLVKSGGVYSALATKLTEPSTNLAVGKYFRIASIDENGHAVLECVDLPILEPKTGTTTPTTSTAADYVGQTYIDTTSSRIYKCFDINNGQFVWKEIFNNRSLYQGRSAVSIIGYAQSYLGIAIGGAARTYNGDGVSIGNGAISSNDGAIQLGLGTNSNINSLQFRDYTLVNTDGTIPPERITSQNWTDTQRLAVLLSLGCTVDENGFVKWTATPSE